MSATQLLPTSNQTPSTVNDLNIAAELEAIITKNEKFVVNLYAGIGTFHPTSKLLFREAVARIHLLCNSFLG
jgi:hypothetical protein